MSAQKRVRTVVEVAQSINLDLPRKLQNAEYRRKFFLAETSARIAEQIIALRKRRDLSQAELAEKAGTHQPAISRVEKSDYRSWSFRTLQSIADAMDARLRVIIEPAEDILLEYGRPASELDEPITIRQPSDRVVGFAYNDWLLSGETADLNKFEQIDVSSGSATFGRGALFDFVSSESQSCTVMTGKHVIVVEAK